MIEPFTWVMFGAGGALLLDRLFRWLARTERDAAYWERERAVRCYREKRHG